MSNKSTSRSEIENTANENAIAVNNSNYNTLPDDTTHSYAHITHHNLTNIGLYDIVAVDKSSHNKNISLVSKSADNQNFVSATNDIYNIISDLCDNYNTVLETNDNFSTISEIDGNYNMIQEVVSNIQITNHNSAVYEDIDNCIIGQDITRNTCYNKEITLPTTNNSQVYKYVIYLLMCVASAYILKLQFTYDRV
jgi:hypothetical protein